MLAGFERPLFYMFSALTLASALYVVGSKNLVRCAFALFFTFLGVAGLYALLHADFVAAAQVLIYIGGILILIIFGVMLTHRVFEVRVFTRSAQVIPAAAIVVAVFLLLKRMISDGSWRIYAERISEPTAGRLGFALMGDYLLQFEVVSILLLLALVGAVIVGRKN